MRGRKNKRGLGLSLLRGLTKNPEAEGGGVGDAQKMNMSWADYEMNLRMMEFEYSSKSTDTVASTPASSSTSTTNQPKKREGLTLKPLSDLSKALRPRHAYRM